jgi:hypothetical protein
MLARSYYAGMDPQNTQRQSPKFATCLDTSLEYLLLEAVRFYAALPDEVAAVHAVETMGFRIGFQLAERCASEENCCIAVAMRLVLYRSCHAPVFLGLMLVHLQVDRFRKA